MRQLTVRLVGLLLGFAALSVATLIVINTLPASDSTGSPCADPFQVSGILLSTKVYANMLTTLDLTRRRQLGKIDDARNANLKRLGVVRQFDEYYG